MNTPFLGLCVIFRDNVDTLPDLLKSVAGHFDDYTFTDTGSADGSRSLVEQFLRDNPGRLTDFSWVDDFAAARNANFGASHARWRMFLDSDDVLVDGHKVKPLLRQVEVQHPQIEGFFLHYVYDRLEELPTMRLCRWRDGWRFSDAIHERLEFRYPDGEGLPDAGFGRTSEFSIVHKEKDDQAKDRAIRRNARIAEREYVTATDPKYRARLARTLAMELKMDGKAEEALPFLEELWGLYKNYPEGRQAAADATKALLHLRRPEEARRWASRAGPAYEGLVAFVQKRWRDVIDCATRSLGRGQQTTHEGFVFEQGVIYAQAAIACLRLRRPPEQAERLLNRIPAKLRNEPAVVPFVNACRKRIDRITIVVPGTPQPFDEGGGGGMLGGSEEAVMYLSAALADLGRNVRVYGVLPPHRVPGKGKDGVDWQPVDRFVPDDEHGTLVLWRSPGMLYSLMQEVARRKAPLPGVVQGYLWLHDTGLGISPEQANAIGKGCTGAVVLSEFHEKVVRRGGFSGKTFRLPNGIPDRLAAQVRDPVFAERDPNSVIYSSCPSRGLLHLLEMWPRVKQAVPGARLDLYYDWSMLEQMQPALYEKVVAAYEKVQGLSVLHHGGVRHDVLEAAMRKANVWAYSHFDSPEAETFCISAVRAQAAGATVLSVPNGALPEVTQGRAVLVTHPKDYEDRLINLLRKPWPAEWRVEAAEKAVGRYAWSKVAEQFSDLWSSKHLFKETA